MLHFLWEAFNVTSQAVSPIVFYRQIALDTGYAFVQNEAMIAVHTKLVEWIKK